MTQRANRIQELFHRVLEVPEDERSAYLATQCDDSDLRREVESLLLALGDAGGFLESGETRSLESAGAVIDRYKLLEPIGEGGFGVVWLAEQSEPVRRRVALKVIKLGMDTRQVVARFDAERQALAMMDHPNIAKVLDGGSTEAGRPYFVMELVRGVPITEFCDRTELDTAARIELFRTVCDAVQHAHQKGIIHRDLKPSNILVTTQGDEPVPKVIDFGVAKATSQELTQQTLFTHARQMIGTPEYMAPEQADPTGLDVDTRADVYSLGVVLYELLTGTRPFEKATSAEAGFQEVLRQIREAEPPKPSTRVATLGERLPTVARQRRTEPRRLAQRLQGDLDWIVLRALEKDRSRRYASARALGQDLFCHLHDLPVEAGPPSAGYRLRKFARRHRAAVVGASLLLLALIAGTVGTLVALQRALRAEGQERTARKEAEDNLARAQVAEREQRTAREAAEQNEARAQEQASLARSVLTLTQEMLRAANPHVSKGPDYTVRQLLDDFERGLGDRLADQPLADAVIRATMGAAFRSLGLFDRARTQLSRALEVLRREDWTETPEYVSALDQWSGLLRELGDLDGARAAIQDAYERSRDLGIAGAAERLVAIADIETRLGHHADAERMARAALGELEAEPVPVPKHLADAHEVLGMALLNQGRSADGEASLRRALQIKRELHGEDSLPVSLVLDNLGLAADWQGRYEEAEQLHRRALEIRRKLLPARHPEILVSLNNLANVCERLGRHDEAERLFREALELGRAILGEEHQTVGLTMGNLAMLLTGRRRLEEAEELLRGALAILRARLGGGHPHVATTLEMLGSALRLAGKLEDAEQVFAEAVELRRSADTVVPELLANALGGLALVRKELGRPEEALPLQEEVAELMRGVPRSHPDVVISLYNLAQNYAALDRYDEQVTRLGEALEIQRSLGRGRTRLTADMLREYGAGSLRVGRAEQGEAALLESLQVRAVVGDEATLLKERLWLARLLADSARFAAAERVLEDARAALGDDAEDVERRRVISAFVRLYDLWVDAGAADKAELAERCRAELQRGR